MGNQSTEGLIYLSNVRLSFPHLSEPQRTINEKTGKERISYNAEFILSPTDPGLAKFMKLVGELAVTKWKEHANTVLNMINGERKQRCFGRGEEKVDKKTFQPYVGYAGNIYLTAGREKTPQIIQDDGTAIDPSNTMAYNQITRRMYGGCRVNAAVKPWIQDNQHGRGVRCDLVAIQFAGDDTPFGSADIDATELFGEVQEAPAGPTPAGLAFPGLLGTPAPTMPPAPSFQTPGLPTFLT